MATQPLNDIIHIASDTTNLPSTGQLNKVEPSSELKTTGYDRDQVVTAENINYILDNIAQWQKFFKDNEGEIRNLLVNAGSGLEGGGDLNNDITINMGTPSTLDGNTSNSTTSTSHTHDLDMASQAESQTGSNNTKLVTPLRVHQAVPYTFSPASVTGGTNSVTLPNGLIMKWGIALQAGAFTVNFPTAFPNACFTVSLTVKNGGAEPNVTFASVTAKTASSFNTYVDAEVPTVGIEWLAIGY